MKQIFILLTMMLTFLFCKGQFLKGTHLINFNVIANFDSHSQKGYGDTASSIQNHVDYNSDNTFIDFNPTYGIFLKENLMLSFGPTFRLQKNKSSYVEKDNNNIERYFQENNTTTSNYGVQFSIERFHNLSEKLFWDYYVSARYSHGTGTSNQIDYLHYERSYDVTSNNVSILGGGGFAYLLTDNWLVNAGIGSLGWNTNNEKRTKSNSTETGSETTDNHFGFNGLYFSFGISMVIK
jgi:hypothetical protein